RSSGCAARAGAWGQRGSMAAGGGEDDGLRANPVESDLPALAGSDADNPPAAPTNGPPQLLPTLRRDSESPAVRAVARRVASALPALGRDGAPAEVPHSARVTADRRRQAKASGAGIDPAAGPAA